MNNWRVLPLEYQIGPDLNIYKTIKPASSMVSKITISLDEEGSLHMKNFGLVEFYQEKEE